MRLFRPATLWALMLVIPTVLIVTIPGMIGQPWENQGRQIVGTLIILVEVVAIALLLWLLEYGLEVNHAPALAQILTWSGLALFPLIWAPFISLLPVVTGWTMLIGRNIGNLRNSSLAGAVWVIGATTIAWVWAQYLIR